MSQEPTKYHINVEHNLSEVVISKDVRKAFDKSRPFALSEKNLTEFVAAKYLVLQEQDYTVDVMGSSTSDALLFGKTGSECHGVGRRVAKPEKVLHSR